ncbi:MULTISPECIES: aminotransferase class IV [unclassified Clostridium]|uniref:aminotransferase class IV n=1 Tax=unclassified Clostridium TaxID=2614128 RepID=UPI0002978D6B|nr:MULTISPECIES: aminotransferase class IV [unclassified Clostridium]EKQ55211.1 MAG: branched-chain amino acid aminotransferase/4-amino-4-deoxychorismate lyase [Clostridium sp. Maddingley MBC34-26]
MRNIIYKNDRVLADEGLFFGRGVFETILWRDKPVLLNEHLERLKKAMIEINLMSLEEAALREYLGKLNIQNKAVKITVTPLNIIITEREISYKKEDYEKGMSLKISKVRRNSTSRLCYIKSTCYIENLIEKENAKKLGYDDVIFLNENEYVTETSCANIFILINNEIFTPKLEDGLLDGIIRSEIIKEFSVSEKSITIEDLINSEEVIITNSLMGAMSVRRINDKIYESKKISHLFNERLRVSK